MTSCQSFRERNTRQGGLGFSQAKLTLWSEFKSKHHSVPPRTPLNVQAIQKKELLWLPAPMGLIQRPGTSRGFAFSCSPFPFLIAVWGQQCKDKSPKRKLCFRTVPAPLPSRNQAPLLPNEPKKEQVLSVLDARPPRVDN